MTESTMPVIWAPAEIAEYLKVGEETVLEELEKDSLKGFKVGSEWRCTEQDLQAYISRGSTAHAERRAQRSVSVALTMGAFSEIGALDFPWPQSGGGQYIEHFSKGYETTGQVNGSTLTFRIGIGEREAVGQVRPRIVVWLGNRPVVEFAGGNDYGADGQLASVIKLPNGRQLPPGAPVPTEYQGFHMARYDSIVRGPYASSNMAIVVHKDDLDSMVRHAIIRAQWKGLI